MTTKNWTVERITRGEARCANCNARLVNLFCLVQDNERIVVGSECVNSYVHHFDARIALALLTESWKQRRTYFYKRAGGTTWAIGTQCLYAPVVINGRAIPNARVRRAVWWAATASSVRSVDGFEFFDSTFASADEAKHFVALQAGHVHKTGSRQLS